MAPFVKEYSFNDFFKLVHTWRRNKTLLEIVKYMISISICLFLLEIYSNYYYTFSKSNFKSLLLGHLSNCGLGDNLVYDPSIFWRCPAHVLERKSDKLKSKDRKMWVHVGYPKGIAEDYFGSHKEDKMFVKYKYKVYW